MIERLVEITEPICRVLDPKKADYLIYDPTGIKAYVTENNPKFLNGKPTQAKSMAKKNPGYDPYKGVYSLLPETSEGRYEKIPLRFEFSNLNGILSLSLQ